MGCPIIPLSCLDPSQIFSGYLNPSCGGFADPENFQAERAVYNSSFTELINNYGVEIGYLVNNFDMEAMNPIYGEHTTMYWSDPVIIKAYVKPVEPSALYTLGGFDSHDTVTLYIAIDTFTAGFSALSAYNFIPNSVMPKAQDKIILYPLGCDRPNGRGAKVFEITEAMDQDVDEINPVMGHYVWRLRGVRSEHNFTTNEPRENVNNQISDGASFGKTESTLFSTLTTSETPSLSGINKMDDSTADATVEDLIYPPALSSGNDSVYGKYF